ncbi:cytidine and deoxycytidylate deaminase zinc-binding region [Leptospira santarosai str. CBC379]|uniref:bifunctional diaminohydroxyphosphoribosylaminopyrimidine deaminase/5-amino-6-(5-phosphoribosylamino)uracil reductase RibD n=1 Tax=Leptospira santarosai TaxID=28183 RepID=UPI000297FA3F|nr:bifunctional diaminohydroxyphosphoribosylaminopyrimidine deaminase/5-amino-6-(5-phosphoribosylamino)uracil reductase [Leptospira santarosai]EKR93279.1 cytidine and deoxycytidylate deaminase zinc-binding region [Leptospira santarosai str. CBC379]
MTPLPEKFREELRKLSFLSTGESSPNPPVSCLISDVENTRILAKGRTSPTGGPHAERNAYDEFLKNGFLQKPHNVWVTLEPCTHSGKTPPCLDLILEHKPKTLYYGRKDPNPLVRENEGLELCRRAGILVVADPGLGEIAEESLFGFFSRIERKRPSMILKTALSKEGFFSPKDKFPIRFTGDITDHLTSILRAKCDAVLVGPGTLFRDNPGLEFRIREDVSPWAESGADVLEFEYGTGGTGTENFTGRNSGNTDIPDGNGGFGASYFLKNVLQYGFEPEILGIHRKFRERYQPYRIFIIFEEWNIPDGWIEKQREINEKNGSKKCVFLLNQGAFFEERTKEQLRSLAEKEIYTFDPKTLAEECFAFLSSIGVNLLLVEGGNLMYETFSPKMRKNDLILKIQTTRSVSDGIRPSLTTNEKTLLWKANVGEDIWEAHGCLRV